MHAAMKAITLWQPWASLCFSGWKKFETRSWPTLYRGPLAIHAAARRCPIIDGDLKELLDDEYGGHWAMDLPRGVVLGTVRLVACRSTEAFEADAPERLCGDWSAGRYCWRFEDQNLFDYPIPAKGMQGFWNWIAADAPKEKLK